jgi:hypothetical protein
MAVMNLQITGRFISPVLADLDIDPAFREKYRHGTADFLGPLNQLRSGTPAGTARPPAPTTAPFVLASNMSNTLRSRPQGSLIP